VISRFAISARSARSSSRDERRGKALSLELLSGSATEIDEKAVARAKKVMHLLVERVLGA
jgi:hypothetical protein